MRTYFLALATVAIGCTTAGVTFAQTSLQQPDSVQQTTFAYDSYYAQDEPASPSDAPAPEAPMAEAYTVPAGCGVAAPACGCEAPNCGSCKKGCSAPSDCPCGYELDCGEPWTLQQCDNRWGITYGGWIAAGITGNDQGFRTNNGNLPVNFNDKSNGAQLNQAWAWAERATDTGGCGWDVGFRIDYIFGTDGQDTQAFGDTGWDTEWDASTEYGSAIPQLYATVAYNDLTVKLGHFYTIIGYEVVPAPDNFFYSHALTMLYGEPFTHTGVLAEYAYNDRVTMYGGWVQGWDSGFNNSNDADMFIGGISLGLTDNVTATYATTIGDFGDGTANGGTGTEGELYMHSLVVDWSITDRLTYVFQHDLGINDNAVGTTEWYGINQYLLYDINCCWAVGGRFEWFNDVDGARVAQNGNANGGDYYEFTLGANYKPHTNLTFRPEIRYDWYNGQGLPYAGGTSSDLLTFGADVIFTF